MHALRHQRKKAGLTLETLAERTGLDIGTLSRIERHKRQLRVAELPLFAKALDCTIEDLLVDVSPPEEPNCASTP